MLKCAIVGASVPANVARWYYEMSYNIVQTAGGLHGNGGDHWHTTNETSVPTYCIQATMVLCQDFVRRLIAIGYMSTAFRTTLPLPKSQRGLWWPGTKNPQGVYDTSGASSIGPPCDTADGRRMGKTKFTHTLHSECFSHAWTNKSHTWTSHVGFVGTAMKRSQSKRRSWVSLGIAYMS